MTTVILRSVPHICQETTFLLSAACLRQMWATILILVPVALLVLAAVGSSRGQSQSGAGARLYRVILPVGDIEQAARFYSQLLGTEGARISPGRHYFDAGGVILALYSPQADGDSAQPRPNFEHIYFAVADLDSVYERAERLGGLSEETGDGGLPMGKISTRPRGERSFYLKDPFGNPLCFVDEKTLFTGQ